MKIDELIETLRTHHSAPQECARRLAEGANGMSEAEAVRGFKTAMAVAVLDHAFGRRLVEALAQLAETPGDAVTSPELRDLETRVAELENRQEGVRSEAAEVRRLEEEIARRASEIEELKSQVAAAAAVAAELRQRCAAKQSLLEKVGHG